MCNSRGRESGNDTYERKWKRQGGIVTLLFEKKRKEKKREFAFEILERQKNLDAARAIGNEQPEPWGRPIMVISPSIHIHREEFSSPSFEWRPRLRCCCCCRHFLRSPPHLFGYATHAGRQYSPGKNGGRESFQQSAKLIIEYFRGHSFPTAWFNQINNNFFLKGKYKCTHIFFPCRIFFRGNGITKWRAYNKP